MKSRIFGILPMAGKGKRLQPIGFSKELYPVVYKNKHFAISEFSIRAMIKAGAEEIKLVINPDKLDIAKFYAKTKYPTCAYFYNSPSLPESCLFPIDHLNDQDLCLFGLPDTLFSPSSGHKQIVKSLQSGADICLGLFQVDDGSKFDSVAVDPKGNVTGVLVKKSPPLSNNIWGIWGANAKTLKKLKKIINNQKTNGEKLLGIGFNKLSKSRSVNFKAVKIGKTYFDIGTISSVVKAKTVIDNFDL